MKMCDSQVTKNPTKAVDVSLQRFPVAELRGHL